MCVVGDKGQFIRMQPQVKRVYHATVAAPRYPEDDGLKRKRMYMHLLLSHAYFVEVVPVADDFAGGCFCVGFVEGYGVCLLRGFARRRVQI